MIQNGKSDSINEYLFEKVMTKRNILYWQSGGPTSVINATAYGIIDAAIGQKEIHKVYIAKNGIIGVINEEIYDVSDWSHTECSDLYQLPGAFCSCRYKLPNFQDTEFEKIFSRILNVLDAHDITDILVNGGNDSQDTANKIAQFCKKINRKIIIGLPKTIDNDLKNTFTCPGYGSAAKYIAVTAFETELDLASMSHNSTKIFIMEVMGRNTGWLLLPAQA